MLGPHVLLRAVLLVLGAIWCKEVLGRLRPDVAELRAHEGWVDRAPTILVWVVTVLVGAWMLHTLLAISAGLLAWV